ncbi:MULTISPECIES: hypothetical protein [unclassified Thioalkalivibrio]|uniref:hypothetical protein n=1 Tax=unclassified Thioalkalivibrio TaxID=2621013 RepID=UPI00037380DC|nr:MULTISPECIES: hypothetical protein [unclassified Thioalkalivibrio]
MSATSAGRLTAAERKARAMQLRTTGATYVQIGEVLGVSAQAAHKMVTKALDELKTLTETEAETVRTLELDRLDRAQRAIWTQVAKGNLGAVDRLLKIQARRAALLGLDAPQKHATTDPSGEEERPAGVVVLPAGCDSVDEWLQQHSQTDG